MSHTSSGKLIAGRRGQTVLDTLREAGIADTSVCGGRGRCTTCRIRITDSHQVLPPPEDLEMRALHRVGAEPNVRLQSAKPVEAAIGQARRTRVKYSDCRKIIFSLSPTSAQLFIQAGNKVAKCLIAGQYSPITSNGPQMSVTEPLSRVNPNYKNTYYLSWLFNRRTRSCS